MINQQKVLTVSFSSIGWIITPQLLFILFTCLVIIQWFIYPEAVQYVSAFSIERIGIIPDFYTSRAEFRQLAEVTSDNRNLFAFLDSVIGILRSLFLSALLFSCFLFVYKHLRRNRYLKGALIPLAAFLVKMPTSIMHGQIVLHYPSNSLLAFATYATLQVTIIFLYSITVVILICGIYQWIQSGTRINTY